MIRFFRAEAVERWQLDPDKALLLDGTRDQLVAVLCDEYDFSIRRAQREVDEFIALLSEKLRRAKETQFTESSAPHRVSAA
jgi:hypothetical protein